MRVFVVITQQEGTPFPVSVEVYSTYRAAREAKKRREKEYNGNIVWIYERGIEDRTNKRWTDEEVNFLVENYDKMSNAELAEELTKKFGRERTESSVIQKAHRLGLRKSKSYFRKFARRRLMELIGYEDGV